MPRNRYHRARTKAVAGDGSSSEFLSAERGEILAAAAEYRADLIVIGSRGHNLISRLFLGSVARTVMRQTALPLLLEWVEPTAADTEQNGVQNHCQIVLLSAFLNAL